MPYRRRMLRNRTTGFRYGYTKPRGTAAATKIQRAYRRRRRRTSYARLRTLERKVSNNRQWGSYELNSSHAPIDPGTWSVISLVNPPQWLQRFQSSDFIEHNKKINLHSCTLQLYYSPEDSLLALTPKLVNVFVVKLKRETALQTLDDTSQMSTAGFNLPANKNRLWDTQDIGLSYEVFPELNRGVFKVLAHRQFQIQNIIQETSSIPEATEDDVAVTTPQGTYKRCKIHFKAHNLIKSGRGDQSWKEMAESELDPLDRYYLLTYVGGNGNALPHIEDDNTVSQGIHCQWKIRTTQ